ncbi:MAG: phosphoribosylglycinamide synthetase [Myxococcaceae bacterium]|nr:phosphoribosylglycinamide synthetase [Myxococcaceae bacterium]
MRVYADDADADDILADMVPRTRAWRDELGWLREAPDCGVLLFEGTGWGQEQDELRRQGFHVIGSSSLGDRLELDRAYGQSIAREVGMQVADTFPFDSFDDAIAFVHQHPGRYVLKFDGDAFAKTRNYIGVLEQGEDMLATLRVQRAKWPLAENPRFVLMEHLSGVEIGVGGFFDGERFLSPVNLDFEHKRFFPGNLGELTGEMGTLVSYRGAERLFEATLGKVAPLLRASNYVGYINLNMIVNAEGAFPLEFTCRLGVPGFAILSALHIDPWDVLLERLVTRSGASFRTHDGFSIGVVLTVPPFPYPDGYERLSKGALIYLHDLTVEEYERLHFGELCMEDEQLVTAGQIGYVMVVTGRGASVEEARTSAYALAKKVVVPNVRYRLDIGASYELSDRAELTRLGWL